MPGAQDGDNTQTILSSAIDIVYIYIYILFTRKF